MVFKLRGILQLLFFLSHSFYCISIALKVLAVKSKHWNVPHISSNEVINSQIVFTQNIQEAEMLSRRSQTGKNNIGAPKMQNNHGAIKLFIC